MEASADKKNALKAHRAKTLDLSVPQWRALAREGLSLPVRIGVCGDSMRPLIRRDRDMVTILPLQRPLKRGDIVLFSDPARADRYVLHRVWRLADEAVYTYGDACHGPDAPLPPEAIWGLAVSVERNGRHIRLDSGLCRLLGRVWMRLHPLRLFALRLRRAVKGCFSR